MEEETTEERQSNEVEVLKAVFVDQCRDLNAGCSVWKPLDVVITVLPQKDSNGLSKAHVQVDLHVIATDQYPNKEPTIYLEKSKGLSDKQLNEMQLKLDQLATMLKGEVMIYEFVQYVRGVLTDNNKPGFESFYEEMLSRQQEKKQKEVQLKKTDEDIQRQLIQLEVKELKKERKRKQKKNPLSPQSPNKAVAEATDYKEKKDAKCFVEDTDLANKKQHYRNNEEDILHNINHNDRIRREFQILDFIGKGAFGDVLKVQNKLDDGLYAIKRIRLNRNNKQLNKKIMREVKLLSRLNHENVVRYYNSWLEECSSDVNDNITPPDKQRKDIDTKPDGLLNLRENFSFGFPKPGIDPNFSDDDDDDESEWITFVHGGETNKSSGTQVDGDEAAANSREVSQQPLCDQFLYIQMEYCEKSTLRSAIDNNLYMEENRVWRLLREIVEGLAYIHQQGIMHRDLKPVNIFIDSEDHVKIGDFGLATPNKRTVAVNGELTVVVENNDEETCSNSVHRGTGDTLHTGQIGTALYVAPELNGTGPTVVYNQKVDIYSLGVIFFEMCYRPLNTEMERIKVLTNLRQYSRNLPEDFLKPDYSRQIKLIRDLLNHDAKERPSAQDILQNKQYIPVGELEECKFLETIHFALSNPQTKIYKHLIAECFTQKISTAEDITFDNAPCIKTIWHHSLIEEMSSRIRKIFHLHGGTYLSTPLLTPNSGGNPGTLADGAVSFMTKYGGLVYAPYDLRVSFARYLAQNPVITHLKRYTIDKVYRERRMFGIHPRELFECSFDIVSPLSSNVSVEAELLYVVYEFLTKFNAFHPKNYLIKLNHSSLVTGILLHYRIQIEKHSSICDWISRINDNNDVLKKVLLVDSAQSLPNSEIPQNIFSKVMHLMNEELPLNKVFSHFGDIMKKQSGAASHCKHGIRQLEMLVKLLEHLSIDCPIVIAPNLVTNYQYYSGIMFQVVLNQKDKMNRTEHDIASGGRYDNLIATYRKVLNITKDTNQSAAGITINLDKLVGAFHADINLFTTVDVLVCSVGKTDVIREKLRIVKDLWSAGIRSTILNVNQSLEETQSYCEEMRIPYIIFVKETETGIAGVRSWLRDRFSEKKLPVTEIVDYLQRMMKSSASANICICGGNSTNSYTNYSNSSTVHHYARSESRSASVSDNHVINISFLTEEKVTSNNKRRLESQIFNTISNSIRRISAKSKIEVLALNVEGELIKQLISYVDINSKTNDLNPMIKKYPRYKKDLNRIIDYVEGLQSKDLIVLLYSLLDNTFKILI